MAEEVQSLGLYTFPYPPEINTRCDTCSKEENLIACDGCKVVYYCGPVHKAEHRVEHRELCDVLGNYHEALMTLESSLKKKSLVPDSQTWEKDMLPMKGTPHAQELINYLELREGYIFTLWRLGTPSSLHLAARHTVFILKWYWYFASHNFKETVAPTLLLVNNLNLECYGLLCLIAKSKEMVPRPNEFRLTLDSMSPLEGLEQWEPFDLSSLKLRFERDFKHFEGPLHTYAPLLLVKTRLLADLVDLSRAHIIKSRVPQEIFDLIAKQLLDYNIVPEEDIHVFLEDGPEIAKRAEEISKQVRKLCEVIHQNYKGFLPNLVRKRDWSDVQPKFLAELEIQNQWTKLLIYMPWAGSPRCIDVLRPFVIELVPKLGKKTKFQNFKELWKMRKT